MKKNKFKGKLGNLIDLEVVWGILYYIYWSLKLIYFSITKLFQDIKKKHNILVFYFCLCVSSL